MSDSAALEARRATLVDQLRRIDEAREEHRPVVLDPLEPGGDPVPLIASHLDEAEELTRAGIYEAEVGLLELLGGAE